MWWSWIVIGLVGWCVVAVVLSLVIGNTARLGGHVSVQGDLGAESPEPAAELSSPGAIPAQRSPEDGVVSDPLPGGETGARPAPTEQVGAGG